MNNNNIDQINLQSSKRKKVRFNLKHSHDTSFGIGEIQPLLCKEVIPGSTSVLNVTSTVRLDPMVAPTYGDLKFHHNFMFVGMEELFPKFSALLAKQPVLFGSTKQIPQYLPHIKLKYLSALCFVGAKFTFYKLSGFESNPSRPIRSYKYSWSGIDSPGDVVPSCTLSSEAQTFYDSIAGIVNPTDPDLVYASSTPSVGSCDFKDIWNSYDSNCVNIGRLMGWTNNEFWIPCQNWSVASFFQYDGISNIDKSATYSGYIDTTTITPGDDGNNDYVFTRSISGVGFCVAVRFSTFGQRMFKLLTSLGYGFDPTDDKEVSLSKLLAVYMAWFYGFAPTLYQGWETTSCARLLSLYDASYKHDYNTIFGVRSGQYDSTDLLYAQSLISFVVDVASLWYTEEQDWVTAHIRSNSVSQSEGVSSYFAGKVPNINGRVNITEPSGGDNEPNTASVNNSAHSFIDQVFHSALDSEVLKRLYKVINRNTIAGRRIKKLLETQGLGEYVKQCRSNFIGHSAVDVEIFDVTVTADTLQRATGDGMYPGEYVGKGVGSGKAKRVRYTANQFGFVIDLAALVPESGWTNGFDLSTRNIEKLDFFHPEYESLGYEASPKGIVTGVRYFGRPGNETGPLEDTFGFVPTSSRHKVIQNRLSGKFALHSVQKAYLPYTFNKFISLGGRAVKLTDDSNSGYTDYALFKLLDADRLPIASPMYRFIGRYPWMGRFMRIFANLGLDALVNYPEYYDDYSVASGESVRWFFDSYVEDPSIVHNVYLYDYYAGMLAIEDSFETKEEGNQGYTDMSIGKA